MSIPRVKDNHYKNGSVVVTWTVTYQQLKTSPLYCTVFCYLRGHLLIVYLIQIHYYSTGNTFVYVLFSLLLDQITIALQKFIRTSDYARLIKKKPNCLKIKLFMSCLQFKILFTTHRYMIQIDTQSALVFPQSWPIPSHKLPGQLLELEEWFQIHCGHCHGTIALFLAKPCFG